MRRFRTFLAGLAGIVAASVVVFVLEMAGHALFLPADSPLKDQERVMAMTKEERGALVATLPPAAIAAVAVGWIIGGVVGGLTAGAIGRSVVPGIVVGGVLVAFAAINLVMFPHPAWMWVASVLILPAAWIGARWTAGAAASPAAT